MGEWDKLFLLHRSKKFIIQESRFKILLPVKSTDVKKLLIKVEN